MRRVLLRLPRDPFVPVAPETVLERNLIASNSGNLVFLDAAHKILSAPGTAVEPDELSIDPRRASRINERYDAYAIPLANAFRRSYEAHLIRHTRLLRQLRIPVTILGVGAQANLKGSFGPLRPMERSIKAFVGAVLDRGPSIGVRGETTAEYLRDLGFRDVEVVGCPSMFTWGPELEVRKRRPELAPDAALSITISPYVKAMAPILERHLERYPNLTYVAQDIDTLELLLWGSGGRTPQDPASPTHAAHPVFRDGRVRFYTHSWSWIRDLRPFDFSFGTRIHGTIAAILAGTPAVILAHDSRTLELARYFGIPYRPMRDVPADLDAAELYAEADLGPLVSGHGARFATFADYLARHGLDHLFRHPGAAEAYDARVATTPLPPPVTSSSRLADPDLLERVRRTRYHVVKAAKQSPARDLAVRVLRRARRAF